jgi:uncharacterized membrane protein
MQDKPDSRPGEATGSHGGTTAFTSTPSSRQHVAHGKAFDPYPYIALNLVLSTLAGIQAPIIMMSQNRAAARDELLAGHHYDETQSIDKLLQANTDLTQQVHDLTQKVHVLTEHLCSSSGMG